MSEHPPARIINFSARAKEYGWVLIAAIFILAFGSAPLVAGYAAQTPDQQFIGAFFDRQDYAVHLAAMQYGEQGNWVYQIRFTSEPEANTYLKTFYVVLGHVSRWTGLGNAAVYQIARLFFGLLACLAVYRLLGRVFPSTSQRRLAFVLAALGSGLGWLQLPLGLVPGRITPIDLWFIDGYLYFSLAIFPHYSAMIAALAIAITAFLDHLQRPHWQTIPIIAVCAIFVQATNPLIFLLADLAMLGEFIFHCLEQRRVDFRLALTLGVLAVVQMPLLLYSYFLFARDPVWVIYSRQAEMLSPGVLYYLLGFGLFWPFVMLGIDGFFRKRQLRLGWAVAWVIAAFGLAYLPIQAQRRFLLAITVPLAVLATPALASFSTWLGKRLKVHPATGARFILAATSLSSIVLIAFYSLNMVNRPDGLFEPTALVRAADWLAVHGKPTDIVLASEPTSQLVGMRTPLRLYSGHEMETINYDDKSRAVNRFYQGDSPPGWLEAQDITWVIWGPHEMAWQKNLLVISGAEIVYQDDQVYIYRVNHSKVIE